MFFNPYSGSFLRNVGVPADTAANSTVANAVSGTEPDMTADTFSYISTNVMSGTASVQHYVIQPEKIVYLLYAAFHNTNMVILAFGGFPVLIPLVAFDRKSRESWIYLFLLLSSDRMCRNLLHDYCLSLSLIFSCFLSGRTWHWYSFLDFICCTHGMICLYSFSVSSLSVYIS